MKIFPVIVKTLPVSEKYDCSTAVECISEWAETNDLGIQISHVNQKSSSFSVYNISRIFYNSFLPMVDMDITLCDEEWQLHVKFRLQKAVRLFLSVYMCVAAALQMALLSAWIINDYSFSLIMLIPAFLLLFAALLSYVGLKASTMRIMKIINKTGDVTAL